MFKYFRKILLFLGLILILAPNIASAQHRIPEPVNIYFFYGDGCPHCADEERFLAELKIELPYINIHSFETWYNRDNAGLIDNIIKKLDIKGQVSGVPVVFISGNIINGFLSADTTGTQIRQLAEYHYAAQTPDIIGPIINDSQNDKNSNETKNNIINNGLEKITLPIFGEMNLQGASLLGLSFAIGFIDGFNPCAMWVLLFLISMLLGMQNKKRMWAIGMTFIVASGIVYFLFMVAWLNIFLFIGFIFWIRLFIGLTAIGSGIYHLREFYRNREGTCKVIDKEKRTKMFEKIKEIVNEKSFTLAIIGIIGLAIMVNMVELVCSAGLPAIYTQVLALNDLSQWQYYLYILLYIFFFMLDDLFVFFIAMITLEMTGVTTKYVKYSRLIGGILMLIIGTLLIFKPQLLMFG